MNTLQLDLKLALRLMVKSPGFTLAAVLSLALGIGANVSVFTWMRQLVLDPLPGVHASSRLIALESRDSSGGRSGVSFSDYLDLRRESRVLEEISAGQQMYLAGQQGGPANRVLAWYGSASLFSMLGVRPALGSFFSEADDHPGSPLTAVLSHRYWHQAFGGRSTVVGENLYLGGKRFRILGVAPEGFQGPVGGSAYDVFVPVEPFISQGGDPESNLDSRASRSFYVLARPKVGVSASTLRQDLERLYAHLEARHPSTNRGIRLKVFPVSESPMGAPVLLGGLLKLLLVGVAFVLLIACANIANLLLARATGRRHEMALRTAVGATRVRIAFQLLIESLLLGVAGGVGGILVSLTTLDLLGRMVPDSTARHVLFQVSLDGPALALAFGLSILSALFFALLPAFRVVPANPAEALKQGGSRMVGSHQRIQSALVVAEIAVAVALLIGAGLMVRSSLEIQKGDPGFEPRGLIYAKLGLELGGYDAPRAAAAAQAIREKVRSLPGVEGVTFSEGQPMSFGGPKGVGLRFEGLDVPSQEPITCSRNLVGPDFFKLFRIPMLEGREVSDLDQAGSEPVVVVNETLAKRYWPNGRALGSRVKVNGTWRRVIGLCKDFKFQTWIEKPEPFVYIPLSQFTVPSWNLVARTQGPVSPLLGPLRELAVAQDPGLPVEVEDMAEVVRFSGILVRSASRGLGLLGLLALFLASLGIYGVMAYSVAQRRAEIGIRMALGATPNQVLRMILSRGLRLVGLGVGLGITGAAALGQRFEDLLYRTDPRDPLVFVGVPTLLGLVALLACVIPAWRASRMDPQQTLRSE